MFFHRSNYVYVNKFNVGIDGALHNLFVLASKTPLRGRPCKNETKMKFLWQGSKIQIVSKWTLIRQERLCIFFREKRTFRFHPLESMDGVITGRKLNTFARFAFQRYYVWGNLINVRSFIDSSSSVKGRLCGNWFLRSF